MGAKSIVRLKIVLDRVEPVVMRRITVRFGVRLVHLHRIVQAAIGWSGVISGSFEQVAQAGDRATDTARETTSTC